MEQGLIKVGKHLDSGKIAVMGFTYQKNINTSREFIVLPVVDCKNLFIPEEEMIYMEFGKGDFHV